jgi:hypothetical protein
MYRMSDSSLYREYVYDEEGDNGVGRLYGYYIHTPDEIYLASTSLKSVIRVNSDSRIVKRIKYADMKRLPPDTVEPTLSDSWSFVYDPIFFVGGHLYINQYINGEYGEEITTKSPVTLIIDTLKKEILPSHFTYPINWTYQDYIALDIDHFADDYSRDFDGRQIIYSFANQEDIYITSLNDSLIRKVPAKSRYIDDVKKFTPSRKITTNLQMHKYECEHPFYGSLIYDKYRDVYYRIAYPPTNMDEEVRQNIDLLDVWRFGRKEFSIIILNKDFQVIGETLFKDYAYSSRMLLVSKEGVYLYNNVFLKDDYEEDALRFRLLKLEKTK